MKILATLLKADAGTARVDGFEVAAQAAEVRRSISLTGQFAAVDEVLTGRENLVLVARLRHLKDWDRIADDLLARFSLTDAADRKVGTYSGGMRRRLDLAMSLIGRPSVLFLDEPTTGLDPRSRLAMWDFIDELVASGMTTLLTTQYLEEADRLAHQIAVIDHGQVIERGTPDELKRRVGGEQIEVLVCRPEDARPAIDALADFACGDAHVERDGRRVVIPVREVHGLVPLAVRKLDDVGIDIDDVGVRHSTLDDVFFALTGRPAEDDEGDGGEADEQERKSA